MPLPKKSIYLSEPARAIVGEEPESYSGRINTIIIRYGAIIQEATPTLAVAEWSAICDALNSTPLEATGELDDVARLLWAEVADADRLDDLGTKWRIDAQDLAERIRAMTYAERVAIIEVVQRFWRTAAGQTGGHEDLLRAAGAVFAD